MLTKNEKLPCRFVTVLIGTESNFVHCCLTERNICCIMSIGYYKLWRSLCLVQRVMPSDNKEGGRCI